MSSKAVLRNDRRRSSRHPSLCRERDAGLVKRSVRGEEAAFAELYRRYDKQLLNYIYRMTGDRERAEDLVQETFVRVYRHLGRFDASRRFSSWVYAIAGNLAKNELRNRARRAEFTASALSGEAAGSDDGAWPLEAEDPSPRPDERFRRQVLRQKVEEAVHQLSERLRIVFVLRELQGKSYEDIAEIAELPVGTVKSRLHRARAEFAKIVGPALGRGDDAAADFWLVA